MLKTMEALPELPFLKLFRFSPRLKVMKRLFKHLHANLTKERFRHVVRVSRTAVLYARRFGLPVTNAMLAALGHDLAREWKDSRILSLAMQDGMPINAEEKANPILLHGRAGAEFLKRKFGINDEIVLEAIRHHTLGDPTITETGMVLFIADYLEPGRRFTDVAFRRSCKTCSLGELVLRCIEHNTRRGKKPHPLTVSMADKLRSRDTRHILPQYLGTTPKVREGTL